MDKFHKNISCKELYTQLQLRTSIPRELIRIIKEKKEVYPNQERLFNTGHNQFILQVKYRLLGGVRLK